MNDSTGRAEGGHRTTFTWLFWVTMIVTLLAGTGLLFVEKVLPGVGVLFGGTLVALVFAGFGGGLLPEGKTVPHQQMASNARGMLAISVIATVLGIVLRLIHPGFLADLLTFWTGPQMIIASSIILLVLPRHSPVR